MHALHILAGPRARAQLRERGLRPEDVRVVPAAAGGPKGLALNTLDRFIFGHWLPASVQTVHLMGASIGAWRMATACAPDADTALRDLAENYILQSYPRAAGQFPKKRDISRVFAELLASGLGEHVAGILAHPRYRLHVITSRGRHIMRREGRLTTPLGYLGAYATNFFSRRAMGGWLERVMFSDAREALPFALHDFRTKQVPLDAERGQDPLPGDEARPEDEGDGGPAPRPVRARHRWRPVRRVRGLRQSPVPPARAPCPHSPYQIGN